MTFPRFHSKRSAEIKLVRHDNQIQLVPHHHENPWLRVYLRVQWGVYYVVCAHTWVFTTKQRTVRFFTIGSVLIFFISVPTVLAAIWYFHSSLVGFLKPDHFLFFLGFFFLESLGQRENCWAEIQSKADSAHASLFSIFIPAQLWLETSVQDSRWTHVLGVSKHYTLYTTQRGVSSYISCLFREVTKICVWGKEGEKWTKGVFRDVIPHTQVGALVSVFWRWEAECKHWLHLCFSLVYTYCITTCLSTLPLKMLTHSL